MSFEELFSIVQKNQAKYADFDAQVFDEAIARQVQADYEKYVMHNNIILARPIGSSDKCTSDCESKYIAVILYISKCKYNLFTVAGLDEHVHACSEYCMYKQDKLLHNSLADIDKYHQYSSRVDNCLYMCESHVKFHACGPWCRETQVDSLQSTYCVLSQTTILQNLASEFDDGTEYIAPQHNVPLRKRHKPREVHVTASHDDYPREGLFGDLQIDNTFYDGMCSKLDHMYAEAYALITYILFSQQRCNIDKALYFGCLKKAQEHVSTYIDMQQKLKLPVFTSTCSSIFFTEIHQYPLYPHLILPKHTMRRYTAACALTCIEFYIQVWNALQLVVADASQRMQDISRNFQGYQFSLFVINVLGYMREGQYFNRQSVITGSWLVRALYPQARTLQELGYQKSRITRVSKHLKQCLSLISSLSNSNELLETTHVPDDLLLFSNVSVVDSFLTLRKQRIQPR